MRQRGPKSAASLSVIVPVREGDDRPMPPAELAPDAASLWRQYVEALPPSWFAREAEPVLAELCETVVLSRRIGAGLSKINRWRAQRASTDLRN